VAFRGLAPGESYMVTRNGADVSGAFERVSDSEAQGVVTGLRNGDNIVRATVEGDAGLRSASLTVRNHPITGPVISGPHQTPFICRTEDAGLGAPIDSDCSIETKYQWFYRSALTQGFNELIDPYAPRSEEHTSELQSLMRITYVVFSLKKNNTIQTKTHQT